MSRPRLSLIASVAQGGAIGRDNTLLWRDRDDLQRFKRLTMGHPIVMGRKTWESLGRPLPGRRNVVVTRNGAWHAEGAEPVASLGLALDRLSSQPEVFVIGGAQIYAEALPRADRLLLTEVDAAFDADTWFPAWRRDDFDEVAREAHVSPSGVGYSFVEYLRTGAAAAAA